MKYQRRAFSLIELIIVVTFLGIIAFIAVPRFNFALISKQKADALAQKIVTDLRLTRRLAISDAVNNVKGYELKMVGNTFEIENVDTHATVSSFPIDSDVSVVCPTGSRFIFGPLGNLESGSGTGINVSAEGKSFTITFITATGTIKCVEN
ncbi:MAG: prepilin-type N-terminal cleavage/methylation domain-containing protein [Planctomycetes bacterium]|nr:prepilin-type N-terminal cleavage/methylation domain-containing protein [Planctomycetota bacterium]